MFLTKTRCQQFKISATICSLTSKHSFTSYRLLYCFTSANAASFFFSQEPSVILVKCFLGQNMRVRPSGDYTCARTRVRAHTHTHTHTHTILWWLQFPLKLGPCSELKRIKYFSLLSLNNFVNSLQKWPDLLNCSPLSSKYNEASPWPPSSNSILLPNVERDLNYEKKTFLMTFESL